MQFQDNKDIFGRMLVLTGNPLFNNLRNAVDNFDADFTDALSWGQLKSKRWLVEELEKVNLELGTVFLCAGWYATLAAMLFDSNVNIFKIRSFDIDKTCAPIADTINKPWVMDNWQFKASTLNILDMQYPTEYTTYRADGTGVDLVEMPNTIINTSCEHIFTNEFQKWYNNIPVGTLLILQNNDYFDLPEHVNCAIDLEDFSKMTPMQTLHYQGTLNLSKYKRFMRIGHK